MCTVTDIEALNTAARLAHRVLPAATSEIIADDLYEHADHVRAGGNLMVSRLQCAQEILEMVDAGEER